MSCHTFTVFYNAHSQLDLSDREKCFIIKHRCLDLLISNVNLRKMNELDNFNTVQLYVLVVCSSFFNTLNSLDGPLVPVVNQTESDSNTITIQIGRMVSNRNRFSRVVLPYKKKTKINTS